MNKSYPSKISKEILQIKKGQKHNTYACQNPSWRIGDKMSDLEHKTTILFGYAKVKIAYAILLYACVFYQSDYFQKIRAVQILAVIMESVSWTGTGDTNVNVSVVSTGAHVKVSLVFRLSNWTIYKSTFIWINNSFVDIIKKSLKIPKR